MRQNSEYYLRQAEGNQNYAKWLMWVTMTQLAPLNFVQRTSFDPKENQVVIEISRINEDASEITPIITGYSKISNKGIETIVESNQETDNQLTSNIWLPGAFILCQVRAIFLQSQGYNPISEFERMREKAIKEISKQN